MRQVDLAAGTDTVIVNDCTSDASRAGNLSNAQLTGFGLESSINYSGVENVDLALGAFRDDLTIDSTISNNTIINTGDGEDVVKIETYDGNTTILTAQGSDNIILFDGDDSDAAGDGAYLELNGGADGDNYQIRNAATAFGNSFVNLKDTGTSGIDKMTFTGSNVDDLIQLDTIYQVSKDPENEFDNDRWVDGAMITELMGKA